jgi:hypothetical protein
MPVMCIYRALNVTREDYDRVRGTVGWEANPPPGAISHSIGFRDDGAVEVDLWDTLEHFKSYQDTRLGPVLAQFGIVVPEPEVLDVYVAAIGPPADAYRVPSTITPSERLQPT